MRYNSLAILTFYCTLLITAAGAQIPPLKSTTAAADTTQTQAKIQYTCSMHPEIISDKPGACPECGMTLVEIQASKTAQKKSEPMKNSSCADGKKEHTSCCCDSTKSDKK
jgi:hypothetical protein